MLQTQPAVGKKTNKAFMILSALGILFVVDVHLGQPLSVLTNVFPYDSFFMPMFAFISGYFFKDSTNRSWKDVVNYAAGKFQKLFLPYLGWAIFYNLLSRLLFQAGFWNIQSLSLRDLIYCVVTSGVTSAFNSPAWFAPLLFCVCIAYCIIQKTFQRFWNDHLALVLFISAGTVAVVAAGTNATIPLLYMVLKVPFFLQFYHLGLYFRKYLEKPFDRLSALAVCLTAVVVNMALIFFYGNTIEFPICSSMSGFRSGSPMLPLVTSVTGTAFWLKISKKLVPFLGRNKLVNYISENTFFIMTHHIGVKHLFIWLCLMGYQCGIGIFSGIDKHQFLTNGLYLYDAHRWCKPACFLFTILFLILACKLWQSCIHTLRSIQLKKQP
jgi:fucose 4-O-acetylase-like acetyltransferase